MKKLYYVLFIIFVFIFILFIYINFKIGSIKEYAAISNAKSSIVLYSLDQNKIDAARSILMIDLVQLIYEYDKDIYEKYHTVKSTLCKDIPMLHMKKIEKYFESDIYKSGEALEYKKNIFSKIKHIKIDLCLNYKED